MAKKQITPAILIICLTFLAGCQSKCWTYKEVVSDYPQFNSAQLKCSCENIFSGIELQLIRGNFGIVAYLSVCSREILNDKIDIQVGSVNYGFNGQIMEGRQRLLLPQEATELLLQSLLSESSIFISLEGYHMKINSANFPRYYAQFKSPSYRNFF